MHAIFFFCFFRSLALLSIADVVVDGQQPRLLFQLTTVTDSLPAAIPATSEFCTYVDANCNNGEQKVNVHATLMLLL